MFIEGITLRLTEIRYIAPCAYHGLECIFLLSGHMRAECGGRMRAVPENNILVCSSGEIRSYTGDPGNKAIILQVSQSFLKRNCGEMADRRIHCDSSSDENQEQYFKLKQLLPQLLLLLIREQKLEFQALLYQFLSTLYQEFGTSGETIGQTKDADTDLHRILDFLGSSYTQRITLADAANLAYMTPQAFSKYFKRKMGVTFLSYLARIRAEGSVTQLLNTEQSIDQIAADQGFANTKAFTSAFTRLYGKTPGAYRKAHRQSERPRSIIGEDQDSTTVLDTDPHALMDFLSPKDRLNIRTPPEPSGICQISADSDGTPAFSFFKMVAIEGGITGIANRTTQDQLEALQSQLDFDYVYLDNFDLSAFSANITYFRMEDYAMGDYVILDSVRYFRQLRFALYIQLDLSYLLSFYGGELELFYARFTRFIKLLHTEPESEGAHPTLFELTCIKPEDAPGFLTFCQRICALLRPYIRFRMGLGLTRWMFEKKDGAALNAPNLPFRFAGLELRIKGTIPVGEQDLRSFQMGQVDRQLDAARSLLSQNGRQDLPLFLTRWNVLAGGSSLESGTFFRSAIILDTLAYLQSNVHGIVFPCCTSYANKLWTDLGMFGLKRIKRPVFFVLDNINRLRGDCLFHSGQVIAVRKGPREFAAAMFSPRYVNPTLSVDHYFVEHERTEISVTLTGLEAGTYRIKRLTYDKDRSGMFERWREIGITDFGDPDVLSRMESIIQPDLYLYEQRVDGALTLHTEVSFNGIVIFEIKGMD